MRPSQFLLVLAFLAGTSAGASAQASAPAKRPMAIGDLITAVRVADPQLSPDGRRVLFVRTTTDSTTGKRNADIWVVAADGTWAERWEARSKARERFAGLQPPGYMDLAGPADA